VTCSECCKDWWMLTVWVHALSWFVSYFGKSYLLMHQIPGMNCAPDLCINFFVVKQYFLPCGNEDKLLLVGKRDGYPRGVHEKEQRCWRDDEQWNSGIKPHSSFTRGESNISFISSCFIQATLQLYRKAHYPQLIQYRFILFSIQSFSQIFLWRNDHSHCEIETQLQSG